MGRLTFKQAIAQLEDADVPCAPIRTAEDIMNDPHFMERGSLVPMRHASMDQPVAGIGSGYPVVFSSGPLPQMAGAPTLGMHNEEIYGSLLGLTAEDLKNLTSDGVL